MKRILYAFLLVIVMISSAASASNVNARFIPVDSEIYDYMDALYSLSSLGKPSTNRPWSENEARLILSKVNRAELDETASGIFDKASQIIENHTRWTIKEFGISANADFTYEMYAHTNSTQFFLESDWIRGYSKRKPLMHFGFEFTASDFFYTSFDANYQFGRASHLDAFETYKGSQRISADGYVGSYKLSDTAHFVSRSYFFSSPFVSNFFTDTHDFSFIWPKRAIFSFGGGNWNLSLNRDRLKIGDAHTGNLLVDDYSDYNDFSRLSVFIDGFRYDWILMFFNTLTSNSEDMTDEARMLMIHTLDFRIFDRVSLKISENVMYRYDVFDLQFLNPAFIFHNLNNRKMFNALAYIELNAQIIKGLGIYLQFAMDQARAPNEGDEQSDSSGWIAGIEHTATALGGLLESYAEFVYTSPLLYRRDGVDFIKVSRYYHQDPLNTTRYSGHIPFFEYIGFQFGGDTVSYKVGTSFSMPSLLKASVSALWLEHGQMNIYRSHNTSNLNEGEANYQGKTPSGDVTMRALALSSIFEMSMESFFQWPGLKGSLELDWIRIWNYTKANRSYSDGRSDIQLSLSITVSI